MSRSNSADPDTNRRSLNQLLADLHREREASWPEAALKTNIDQRRTLVENARFARFPRVGDVVQPFVLAGTDGHDLSLDTILRDGPAVLVFFRFATCPACNIVLPYYQRQLWPALQQLGVALVAISPQIPERLVEIKTQHQLGFAVASDKDAELGRRLGILYEYDQPSKNAALAAGKPIGAVTGTGTWELPQPAALLVDQNRIIQFADVSPDWLVRTEAEPILSAARRLVLNKAA